MSLSVENSSSRPEKMQRLEAPVPVDIRKKLPYDLQQLVASFLVFKEAVHFLGHRAFWEMRGVVPKPVRIAPFLNWQRTKNGISTEDWPKRDLFPQMCQRIVRASQLSWLQNLTIQNFEGEALRQLTSSKFPHLERLTLKLPEGNSNVQNQETIVQLVKNSPKLAHITVTHLGEAQIVALAENCPKLVSLRVCAVSQRLFVGRAFEKSELLDWSKVSEKVSKKASFQDLFLSESCAIYRTQLQALSTIPQLRNITIQDQETQDSDLWDFKAHPGLQVVRLRNLPKISDDVLKIFTQLPCLTTLEIQNCEQISPFWLPMLAQAKQLSQLVLHKFKAADRLLFKLSSFCPSLTSIRLVECAGIAPSVGDHPHPVGFSNFGLKRLGMCPKLEEVEIVQGSELMTDMGMYALASNTLRRVKFVTAKRQNTRESLAENAAWKNLTPKGFLLLIFRSTHLQVLALPKFSHWKKQHEEQLKTGIQKLRSGVGATPLRLTFG